MKKSTFKRAAALAVAGMMTATALVGCGEASSNPKDSSGAAGKDRKSVV